MFEKHSNQFMCSAAHRITSEQRKMVSFVFKTRSFFYQISLFLVHINVSINRDADVMKLAAMRNNALCVVLCLTFVLHHNRIQFAYSNYFFVSSD